MAKDAWDAYLLMETSHISFNLLTLIANETYKTGQYYYALKAFDILYNVDPHQEHWDGKKGAICGIIKRHIEDPSNQDYAQYLQDAELLLKEHTTNDAKEVMQLLLKFK